MNPLTTVGMAFGGLTAKISICSTRAVLAMIDLALVPLARKPAAA